MAHVVGLCRAGLVGFYQLGTQAIARRAVGNAIWGMGLGLRLGLGLGFGLVLSQPRQGTLFWSL